MSAANKKVIYLIISVLIPLAVGGLSSILTSDQMKIYHFLNKPALSPPGWVFPVVWTVLYILMGYAFFRVWTSNAEDGLKTAAVLLYFTQLLMNFFWSLIFFNQDHYLLAFVWLIIMLAFVIVCAIFFYKIDRTAGLLMIPYIAWGCFAAYLNLSVYILSITPMPLHK